MANELTEWQVVLEVAKIAVPAAAVAVAIWAKVSGSRSAKNQQQKREAFEQSQLDKQQDFQRQILKEQQDYQERLRTQEQEQDKGRVIVSVEPEVHPFDRNNLARISCIVVKATKEGKQPVVITNIAYRIEGGEAKYSPSVFGCYSKLPTLEMHGDVKVIRFGVSQIKQHLQGKRCSFLLKDSLGNEYESPLLDFSQYDFRQPPPRKATTDNDMI